MANNQGQAQKAARLFGWADATRLEIEDPRPPAEQADVDRDTAMIIEMIDEEAYTAAYADGQKVTIKN